MTEKKRNIYHLLKRPFQNIKPIFYEFQILKLCWSVSAQWYSDWNGCRLFAKYSNDAFYHFLPKYSKYFPQSYSVFAAKVFKVFPSKLFWYLQVLRNYLLSKNISVSKSIIWLSHQVVIYFPDFTFFLNFLHKSAFTFHFTLSFNIFVQHHWPNLARS